MKNDVRMAFNVLHQPGYERRDVLMLKGIA
jgi:hypothetical protein